MRLLLLLALCLSALARAASPVGYEKIRVGRATYHVVRADLSNPRIEAAVVSAPKLVSVWQLVSGQRAVAAVTGTFFDPGSQRPVADVFSNGVLKASGHRATLVGFDLFGAVQIRDVPFGKPVDWSEFRHGLRGAVRVVTQGRVRPDPKAQRFRDPRIWGKAARTGLGVTKHGKLVLIATSQPVYLRALGRAMVRAGVREGVALDGGGSTSLYYRGRLLAAPTRKLNNVVVVRVVDPKATDLLRLVESQPKAPKVKVASRTAPKPKTVAHKSGSRSRTVARR
ncbi:MAG: phosphodiester glycosidase family protein [Fimbriimonadales bacterium]|nr:phosphodiester glycosidase family protein [Fimbriimonadales bacterium]